jgi:hypothetical protein
MKHDTDIPKVEDWEAELKKNPWSSGRLRRKNAGRKTREKKN